MTNLPNHKHGYTENYLKSILGDDWDNFSNWMRGQTVMFDTDTNECVYYTFDVKKYLSGNRGVLD
jgi:hypothetical protein